jgi:hypothetical protein
MAITMWLNWSPSGNVARVVSATNRMLGVLGLPHAVVL